jgi:hypothetical protein
VTETGDVAEPDARIQLGGSMMRGNLARHAPDATNIDRRFMMGGGGQICFVLDCSFRRSAHGRSARRR